MQLQFLENYTQLRWDNCLDHTVVIVPILSDKATHRVQNRISFLYIADITANCTYIVGCYHNDLGQNGQDWISSIQWPSNVFSYKKSILLSVGLNTYDLDLCNWLQSSEPIDVKLSSDVTQYYNWYSNLENINDIIPIVNFLQYCRTIVGNFRKISNQIELGKTLQFYNNIVLDNWYRIENCGIPTDPICTKQFVLREETTLYTQYNMFTSTGRPSNAFGGINFAALDKKTGVRSMINAPKDSMLVEFDYDSYHIRLVAKLIGYELPAGNLHQYFGQMYFNTDSIEGELYERSKQLTFRLLYGVMLDDYKHIDFFQKVDVYRKQLWSEFKNNCYVVAPVSGRKLFKHNYKDMTSTKLFNYVLQGYETDVNSIMIHQVLTYLYNKTSQLILYTYDSFLFVIHGQDGKDVVTGIKNILTQFNFKVNCKVGFNYNNMKLKNI